MKTQTNQTETSFQTIATGKYALTIAILCFAAALAPNQAFAKSCRNVYLEVKNNSSNPIKIVDLDYWDSESEIWRSEPVRNEVIKKHRVWQETRNLEHVNNQPVKIRAEYRTGKWSKLLKRWNWSIKKHRLISPAKTCTKGTEYSVTIR